MVAADFRCGFRFRTRALQFVDFDKKFADCFDVSANLLSFDSVIFRHAISPVSSEI